MNAKNAFSVNRDRIVPGIELVTDFHSDFEHVVLLGEPKDPERLWVPVSPDDRPTVINNVLLSGRLKNAPRLAKDSVPKMVVSNQEDDPNRIPGLLIKMNMFMPGLIGRGLYLVSAIANQGPSKLDVLQTTSVILHGSKDRVFSHHNVLHELAPNDAMVADRRTQRQLPGNQKNPAPPIAVINSDGRPLLTTSKTFHNTIREAQRARSDYSRARRNGLGQR